MVLAQLVNWSINRDHPQEVVESLRDMLLEIDNVIETQSSENADPWSLIQRPASADQVAGASQNLGAMAERAYSSDFTMERTNSSKLGSSTKSRATTVRRSLLRMMKAGSDRSQ